MDNEWFWALYSKSARTAIILVQNKINVELLYFIVEAQDCVQVVLATEYCVQVVGNKQWHENTGWQAWTKNWSERWRCDRLCSDEYTMNSAPMNNSSRTYYSYGTFKLRTIQHQVERVPVGVRVPVRTTYQYQYELVVCLPGAPFIFVIQTDSGLPLTLPY